MSRHRRDSTADPESLLPLHRDTFHILVSLADRERHGYAVMQDVLERTDGKLRLSPSSLCSESETAAPCCRPPMAISRSD